MGLPTRTGKSLETEFILDRTVGNKTERDEVILRQAVQGVMGNAYAAQRLVQIQPLCKAIFQEGLPQQEQCLNDTGFAATVDARQHRQIAEIKTGVLVRLEIGQV